mgnify:CR=1 FL=1
MPAPIAALWAMSQLNVIRQVSEASSLRKAGREFKISVNTVRAKLDRLEHKLGTTLFSRSRDGLRVTAEGRSVIKIAREMHLLGSRLPAARGNHVLTKDGEVRIAASEGIANFWLTPQLMDLKIRLPDHLVSLSALSDQKQIVLDGFDVAIGFV